MNNRAALTEALDSRGVTDKVAASLRAEMYSLLAARDAPPAPTPGESSNETRLINSLILEYLDYTLLTHTRSVLALETGTQQPLSRGEMRRETGVEGDPRVCLSYLMCLIICLSN